MAIRFLIALPWLLAGAVESQLDGISIGYEAHACDIFVLLSNL